MNKLSKRIISSRANETLSRGDGARLRRSHPHRAASTLSRLPLLTFATTAGCQTNLDSDKPPGSIELPPTIISGLDPLLCPGQA